MSKKRKVLLTAVCVCVTLLCVLANPGALLEPRGLLLLVLTNFFLYRVFSITRRKRRKQTDKT